MKRTSCLLILALVASAAAAAKNDCMGKGSIIYDDGTFENAYTFNSFSRINMVMQFDLPPGPTAIDEVCVCWRRSGTDTKINFDLRIWAADGDDGGPGTLLGQLENVTASNLSTSPRFYNYDVSSLDIITSEGAVYIGPSWFESNDEKIYLCTDESLSTPLQRGFAQTTLFDEAPTREVGKVGAIPDYRAFGIRAKVSEGPPPGPAPTCVPDETSHCLSNGRFRVTVEWRNVKDEIGVGHAVPLGMFQSDDSGLFYFFNPDNWEMLVKVLDKCGKKTDNFWVFAAATTDVEYTLRVEDTETGEVNEYFNPLGTASPAITDTDAFATCP